MLALSASVFWACKEEPSTKTMAEAPAPETKAVASKLKAKVRKALGDANLLRKGHDSWTKLRIGQNVVENDRIRTAAESEAVLSMNDGSSLWITELSDITLDVEIFDSLSRQVSVVVKDGSVHFDVQKQNPGNSLQFKTGTATAAIRGTAGFVGNVNGVMVASLKEGAVAVTSDAGVVEEVLEKQTVLVANDGSFKKIALESSGTQTLSMEVVKIIRAGEKDAAPAAIENVEKQLQDFDNGYAARKAAFEKKLNFRASPLAAEALLPNVTLQARVNPGVVVTVLGESDTVPESGIYQRTFEWDENAYGVKRFLAVCSEGDVEVLCHKWETLYAAPAAAVESAAESAVAEPAADSAIVEPAVDTAAAPAKDVASAPKMEKPAPKENAVDKPKAEESRKAESKGGKDIKFSVKMGRRTESVHLDLPATEYSTKLKFQLAGIDPADLKEIKDIKVRRAGKVIKTYGQLELNGLNYEIPVSIDLNKIANFEVVVTLKNGKSISAKKTYEVFCFRRNHMGKARNCVKVDKVDGGGCAKNHDEEYEYVKSNGVLTAE